MIAYHNGIVFDGNAMQADVAVLVNNQTIAGIISPADIPPNAMQKDLNGHYLAPSFIDLQLYGGYGQLFSQELSVASLEATYRYCLSGGCTHFMITMATNAIEAFLKGIEVVKEYWQQAGKGLLGLHLEGPYINPSKRGAHIERYVKQPTIEEVLLLLKHGKDVVKMMTVAPEQCAAEIIQLLSGNGVIISAGHSNANYGQAMTAFNNGIPAATHLFNAMSPLQHRAPGLPGAVMDHPGVMSSIVADGIHVDFAMLRISKKIMQHRLFLITDAVTETTIGEYQHVFKGDRYTLPDGTLSGSSLTMMKAVKNCVDHAGIDLPEALRMASLYPAQLAGINHGKIQKDASASFVVFNKQLEVVETINA
jgi:N-acetylglucosamine-6-phosphate deacetylase